MDTQPVLKPLEKTDYPALNALFIKVFGRNRSLETWEWKYDKNPHGSTIATIAVTERAEEKIDPENGILKLEKEKEKPAIIGFYGLIPRKVSCAGNELLAFQEVDLMVDPEHTRGGLFKRLGKETYSRLMDQGHPFTFGFPNTTSLPAGKRILGWKAIERIPLWTMLLEPSTVLAGRIMSFPGLSHAANGVVRIFNRITLSTRWKGDIIESPAITDSFMTVIQAPPADTDIVFMRDRDYLKWRYQQCPGQHYTFFIAQAREGQCNAAAVLGMDSTGRANLAEFRFVPGHEDAGTALLRHLAWYSLENGCTTLRAWALADSEEARFLSKRGFFNRNAMNYHVIRSFRPPEFNRMIWDPRRWRLSSGDSDCV
jgi:hypothetical protein